MQVSIAGAQKLWDKLIRAVEQGETVVITRRGKPVAQLTGVAPATAVHFGFFKGRMKLLPGWDEPLGEEYFLSE
ncbi:MAG: type II toxin-antitoxin system prevent-host-death family antitoxin [Bryobacterales bacterium]|nr:type II toxin-antitoxin system prevent-host-death family antitoxin [Bryobacterales bacterium]